MKFSNKRFEQINSLILGTSKEVLCSLCFLSIIALYPTTARAGVISFFSDLVSDRVNASENQSTTSESSSKMALLQAAVNIDPQTHKAPEIPRIEGNALVAEIGPSGTLAEVDSHITTQISTYVVRSGDTLSEIASIFGVSVNTIMWANDITRASSLKDGQILVILPISGVKHTVAKGDTVSTIAKRYKADIDEILAYNDMTISTMLTPGQVLVIPDGEFVSPNSLPGTSSKLAGSGPVYLGYYSRPIKGGSRTQGIHGYNAVDLADKEGTPIYASAPGKVIVSVTGGWNGGYGNYIVISHPNGTQTLYAHNSKNLISVGEQVVAGQIIALMGSTGKSTGPHVHFEIRGAKNPF